MAEYVLGVDLGTSAVKVSALNRAGEIVAQGRVEYPLHHPHSGYSEQDPEDWVKGTTQAIKLMIQQGKLTGSEIDGLSFSGQMHGLVLLDAAGKVLRPAILWNDTRTTPQRDEILAKLGDRFLEITKNQPLEGFTLPKLLWVKENEPEIWAQVATFLLPKDYVRYRMTGKLAIDYSDATGTVLLDVDKGTWSQEICDALEIPAKICPPLVNSTVFMGTVTAEYARESGLAPEVRIYAGAADNASGAVGAGILSPDTVLSSIGTSGVVLKYETNPDVDYHGVLQFEDHAIADQYYSMGVTLAAGDSLNWFKRTFAPEISFNDLVNSASESPLGSRGLLYTPYLVGERAPYPDARVRGSWIGIDSTQGRGDFARAVIEGITFSFNDIMQIYREQKADFKQVVAIGGGAKSQLWLQIQADVFNLPVVTLQNEQGPGLGAAMIAAVGLGWFKDFQACAKVFVKHGKTYYPIAENVERYQKLYQIYHQVYQQTRQLTDQLADFR